MKLISLFFLILLFTSCTTTKTVQTDLQAEIKKSDATQSDVKAKTNQAEKTQNDTRTDTKVTEEIEIESADPNVLKELGIKPDSKSGTGTKPFRAKIKRTTETKTVSNTETEKEKSTEISESSETESDQSTVIDEQTETETEAVDFWHSLQAYLIGGGILVAIGLFLYVWFKGKAFLPWIF